VSGMVRRARVESRFFLELLDYVRKVREGLVFVSEVHV
jgi:hypothetical protein